MLALGIKILINENPILEKALITHINHIVTDKKQIRQSSNVKVLWLEMEYRDEQCQISTGEKTIGNTKSTLIIVQYKEAVTYWRKITSKKLNSKF